MGFVSLPHLVEELVEETQVMGDAKQGQRRRHQEHSQGAAQSGEEIHGDAERGAWGVVTSPKWHPSLHWGPLWDLVAPDGDGTQRDGDKPKVSPIIALETPMGFGGTKWGQDTEDGDNSKVSPIIALRTLVGFGGTRWGQDSKGW